jgi:hypothetical protein
LPEQGGFAKTGTFSAGHELVLRKNRWYHRRMEPTVALCMIVRDEQAVLRRCLASVAPAVDAIYITDTGSKDATVEIAQEFGAHIRHFTWCDDFSAARNHSISGVKEDWLLILDADDEFPVGEALKIRQAIKATDAVALTVNYSVAEGYTPAMTRRILRNHTGLSFSGFIHESIRASLPDGARTEDTGIGLKHTGYVEPQQAAKLQRNLPLLGKEQARCLQAGDMFQQLVIGRELAWAWFQLGEVTKGEQMLQSLLANGWPAGEEIDAYAVEVLATLHWHLHAQGKHAEAWGLGQALSPRLRAQPAFWLYHGLSAFRMGRFAGALQSLDSFEDGWLAGRVKIPVPLIYTGSGLWDLQGQCCLNLGMGERALALFSKCLAGGGDSQEYAAKMHLARQV